MIFTKLEFQKIRRKHFGLITLAASVFSLIWLFGVFHSGKQNVLNQGYLGSFYQLPIINSIILPVFISVLCSRLCDMEHKGNNWKLLLSLQTPKDLFRSKLICTGFYLLAATMIEIVGILLIGTMLGFKDRPQTGDFLLFFVSQYFVSLFLALLIQVIALKYSNQFIALTAGLIGSFLGLLSMFFPAYIMRLTPSAYYALLSTVSMDYNSATRIVTYQQQPFHLGDFLLLAGCFCILYVLGLRSFSKREV